MTTPSWLAEIQRGAKQRFEASGYPTPKLEDWRFTNVAPIARKEFRPSANGLARGVVPGDDFAVVHGSVARAGCVRSDLSDGSDESDLFPRLRPLRAW